MKLKGFWYDRLLVILLAVLTAVIIGLSALLEPQVALAEFIAALVIFGIAVYRIVTAKQRYKKFMEAASQNLDFSQAEVLASFPFPVAVCDSQGYIRWCSKQFYNEITNCDLTQTSHIDMYTNGIGLDNIIAENETLVQIKDRYYSVFPKVFRHSDQNYCILFYLNNTKLKKAEIEYLNTRPYALVIELDNIDDSRSEFRDSERTEIKSRVEAEIDKWAESYGSTLKKVADDRYLIFTEQRNITKMIEERFTVLETIRNFSFKEKKIGATLSIGISGGSSFKECEKEARKAIEMALGRGGDQVAIKKPDNTYDFFGGVSKSSEKRTKVKSRIVGNALAELIKSSSNVIVMGHNYTDLDAIGAAVGIACAAVSFDIPVHIATDKKKTLAGSLIKKLEAENMGHIVIGEEQALELITKKTILVVVDTHIDSFVEFPSVYQKAEIRVIIDHHRRSISDVNGAVIFHHDPGASSASEMVTELLQYMGGEVLVNKTVAEALLAGIMLDTKNFIIRAGVRTFEAAAFLKDKGADTVSVKKLFANSIDVSRMRNRVISNAESYKSCAVSVADFKTNDIRIVTAQAADELLNVTGIKASFVMFESNDTVNISARSLGEMNVQIIMEALGGGGHQTMAACQLKGYNIPAAKAALCKAIDDFYALNS